MARVNSLDDLNNDILTYIFTILSIPEILLLRQVSRRLQLASKQHTVWKTVCTNEILANGIPFSKRPLTSFSAKDLEEKTLHAYRLGLNWMSPTTTLRRIPTSFGKVFTVNFVFHHGRNWIITTAMGTAWWMVNLCDCDSFKIVAQWCHFLFHGVAVNKDDQSDATFAISVSDMSHQRVKIFGIFDDDAHGTTVEPQRTLDTSKIPISLNGDLIALCDHHSEMLVLNWKTDEQALFKSPDTLNDQPRDVAFINGSILVVGFHSVCIFDEPRMVSPGDYLHATLLRVFQSFHNVRSVSLASGGPPSRPSASLLICTSGPSESTVLFQFMTLNTDLGRTEPHTSYDSTSVVQQDSSPSPFNLITSLSFCSFGKMLRDDVVLGPFGTAVWMDRADYSHQPRLIVALFPGLLNHSSPEVQIKADVAKGDWEQWCCLDYDEIWGLIALGSNCGGLAVYRL